MITHFIGKEEVEAYCSDLYQRLNKLEAGFPLKWFMLGESGQKIASVLFKLLPSEISDKVKVITVFCDRKTGEVNFDPSLDEKLDDSPILLIDSAVHTGRSMSKIIDELWIRKAKNVVSYTLVLKRSSSLVPTYFGVLLSDTDRAYFQLDVMPNNRLCERQPFGALKAVSEQDFAKKIEGIEAPFQGVSVGDLIYEMETKNHQAYLYALPEGVAGFVSFAKKGPTLFIDGVGVAKAHEGKGIGGALIRWAENWGRSNDCSMVELLAYEKAIPKYQNLNFEFANDKTLTLAQGESYRLMRRKLLYNTKVTA